MIRPAHAALGGVVLTLVATMGLTSPPALGDTATPSNASATSTERAPWVPPVGVIFSSPFAKDSRALQRRTIRAIDATEAGETIKIAVWNFDDRQSKDALVEAKVRGVNVQIVVAGLVDNPNWNRLERRLNRNTEDESFAVQCSGGCRSRTKIMHSKFYIFSRVNTQEHISMLGSVNMTHTAGERQWNDMLTAYDADLYDYLSKTFDEYAQDKALDSPYDVHTAGKYRVTLYPVGDRNPQAAELSKVRCRGTTGGTGNGAHRTVIRLAVAGWFDDYGQRIANRVRELWDQGCDVRILTTLAGRGINQTFRDTSGRGPVPIKKLTVDRNNDEIPEMYLHMKAMSISGVYDGDTSASVIFTGSPNWSSRAARSEEIWVRAVDSPGLVSAYERWINKWYFSNVSHAKLTTPRELRAALERHAVGKRNGSVVPDWLELH